MNRLKLVLIYAVLTAFLVTGCGNSINSPVIKHEYSFDKNKIDLNVVQANTEFAFDVFKQLNKEDGEKGIFISPFSVSTVLSMIYQGARTKTMEAMADTLNYRGMDINKINESYKNLLNHFKQTEEKVELNMGNSIWIKKGNKVRDEFLTINKQVFDSEVNELDFSSSDAVNKINNWISGITKGKIKKMIEPPIAPEVLMYLVNGIYFKGEWTEKFDKKQTFNTKFQAGNGKGEKIRMMKRTGNVQYGEAEGYQAVKLPYGKGTTAMYCILPKVGTSVNDFIESLDSEKWKTIRANISERENVQLQIPRFKLEYGIKNLNDSLTALGMGVAFGDSADFSGIEENVAISRVLHKAVIEVNEEGSEAAAVTVGEVKTTALALPTSFIADRPFVFVIADDITGTILFMGKLYDIG